MNPNLVLGTCHMLHYQILPLTLLLGVWDAKFKFGKKERDEGHRWEKGGLLAFVLLPSWTPARPNTPAARRRGEPHHLGMPSDSSATLFGIPIGSTGSVLPNFSRPDHDYRHCRAGILNDALIGCAGGTKLEGAGRSCRRRQP